jgi:hypothetical protein
MPAMNEEKTIASVVSSVATAGFEVIVVDDGSLDNTAKVAKQNGATVLSHVKNLGAWKATQAGIRYAYANGFDLVITMDADGQHNSTDIPKLLEKNRQGADVVIGNCTERGSTGRHIAWRFFKSFNRLKISDITSGFRLYNRTAMYGLISRQATMLEYQCVGILILLRNMQLQISEVSVPMQERSDGISRIFYSWGAVFYYLMYSGLLSMTKAFPIKKDKFIKKIKH